ncbi:MAG: threonylcarbamoyl-AMP synthase [Rhodothermales bacterium]|nr:threonylcarbamoyl-AMP synthase [Rhodothermales bacterium]
MFIRRGKLAAFPTETVYGLGADAWNAAAVKRIYEVKGRPLDNPMIVHVANRSNVLDVADSVPPIAEALMSEFFPGPLTLVLNKAEALPPVVTAGLSTVGIRVPSHPVAQDFLRACGTPVVAPSANRSGAPSPTSWESVSEDLYGLVECILQGGRSPVGLESTVVDCTATMPVILREGAVSLGMLREVVPSIEPASASAGREHRSPGRRHRHYAPRATVRLYEPATAKAHPSSAYIGITAPQGSADFGYVLICRDADHYAHEIFHFLRECDRKGLRRAYCERPPEAGVGAALLDRIMRAGDKASGSD